MIKRLLIVALALCIANVALAQRYQGSVEFGYMASIQDGLGRIPLHFVNGVRFNDSFFAGVGVGANFHHKIQGAEIPIYLNCKYYFNTFRQVLPFLSADAGGYFGVAEARSLKGFTMTPAVGVSVLNSGKSSVNFSLGYNYQTTPYVDAYDAIVLKLGYVF